MVGLYTLIEVIVLILNGLAVLHDERFLAPRTSVSIPPFFLPVAVVYLLTVKFSDPRMSHLSSPVGLGYKQETDQFGQPRSGVKQKIAELLYAVRLIGRSTSISEELLLIMLVKTERIAVS